MVAVKQDKGWFREGRGDFHQVMLSTVSSTKCLGCWPSTESPEVLCNEPKPSWQPRKAALGMGLPGKPGTHPTSCPISSAPRRSDPQNTFQQPRMRCSSLAEDVLHPCSPACSSLLSESSSAPPFPSFVSHGAEKTQRGSCGHQQEAIQICCWGIVFGGKKASAELLKPNIGPDRNHLRLGQRGSCRSSTSERTASNHIPKVCTRATRSTHTQAPPEAAELRSRLSEPAAGTSQQRGLVWEFRPVLHTPGAAARPCSTFHPSIWGKK